MSWYEAALISDFKESATKVAFIDDIKILIIHLNGHFYAIEDLCTHDGGDLAGGQIEGGEIICPRHGAHFCITTGAATQPPAYENIQTFPTKIVGDKIFVDM